MKILALEASAAAASCALLEDEKILGEYFMNIPQTHSQTLMPMVQRLLDAAGADCGQLDLLAVSAGPGSFTGLRIAMAAVKGMAFAGDIPCVGVSTLEALAYNLPSFEGAAVPVMDARCSQVYTAMFDMSGDHPARRLDDCAISLTDLAGMLSAEKKTAFLVGDGAVMCYNELLRDCPCLKLAPANLRFQRASSVGLLAARRAGESKALSADELAPVYLRLPQAERELLRRREEK